MSFLETTDINYNVRQNNNIVWRNVNIEDLFGDQAQSASFLVRGVGAATSIDLAVELPDTVNFIKRHGSIAVGLDPALYAAWQANGGHGTGFKVVFPPASPPVLMIGKTGAAIEDIPLIQNETHPIQVTFTAPVISAAEIGLFPDDEEACPECPRPDPHKRQYANFQVDFVQIANGDRVGGVGYRLHVFPPATDIPALSWKGAVMLAVLIITVAFAFRRRRTQPKAAGR
jgi:hypothetical protein